jgi:hypothetical protein
VLEISEVESERRSIEARAREGRERKKERDATEQARKKGAATTAFIFKISCDRAVDGWMKLREIQQRMNVVVSSTWEARLISNTQFEVLS